MFYNLDYHTIWQWEKDGFWGTVYPFSGSEFWVKYWIDFLGSFLFFASIFCMFRFVIQITDSKRLAWGMSIFNASFLAPLSIPFCIVLFQTWFAETSNMYQTSTSQQGSSLLVHDLNDDDDNNHYDYTNITTDSPTSLFLMSNHRLSEFMSVFFIVFLIMDSLLGFLFYPNEVGALTGWVHHLIYFIFVMNALYWKFTNVLATCLLEELPTIILAVGSVFPKYRNDLAFGITFFSTRIVFHSFFLILAFFYIRNYTVAWIGILLVLIVHIFWFTKWVLLMRRREQKRTDMGLNPEETDYLQIQNDDKHQDEHDNNNEDDVHIFINNHRADFKRANKLGEEQQANDHAAAPGHTIADAADWFEELQPEHSTNDKQGPENAHPPSKN